MRDLLIKLQKVEKRWVYLAVAIACAWPFIANAIHKPIKLSVQPTPETRGVYDYIEAYSEKDRAAHKVVVIDAGWDMGSMAENQGMTEAVIEHLFRKKIPFVLCNIGGSDKSSKFIMETVMAKFTKDHKNKDGTITKAKYSDRVYGKDWVNLGYVYVLGWPSLNIFTKDISALYPTDYYKYDTKDFDKLPIMKPSKVEFNSEGKPVRSINIDDVYMAFVVTYSPCEDWIPFVHGIYNTPLAFGCAGIESSTKYRFLTSGQLKGLLVSVRGGAEYDVLLNPEKPADRTTLATTLIAPLAYGHLVIIFAIVLGNIGYFAGRRRRL